MPLVYHADIQPCCQCHGEEQHQDGASMGTNSCGIQCGHTCYLRPAGGAARISDSGCAPSALMGLRTNGRSKTSENSQDRTIIKPPPTVASSQNSETAPNPSGWRP